MIDQLWADMLLDACASDGPIRDADVREAMKRGRPEIEAAVRRATVERIREAVAVLRDTWTLMGGAERVYLVPLDDLRAILDEEAGR